jgi:hypothetical protein
MRNNTSNPARRIVDDAVKAVRNDRTKSPAASTSTSVPFAGTGKGVDDDENIYTIHTAITQLDGTNSGAVTGEW